MRVSILKSKPDVYSGNSYLVRGDWNKIDDVNTLIDVGTDGSIVEDLITYNTGVGKHKVDQVIITHEHFDHAGGLKKIIEEFRPRVLAYNKLPGVTQKVFDQMEIKIGDRDAVILYSPGHSNDSICIYCEEEQALFSGDTPLFIKSPGGTYSEYFIDVINRLINLKIKSIYSGHDLPIVNNADEILKNTLRNILLSKIVS